MVEIKQRLNKDALGLDITKFQQMTDKLQLTFAHVAESLFKHGIIIM